MADESQVDQLLDEWEELRESNPRLLLDTFIKERLEGADSELVESFRDQAENLASIDRQMELVAWPLLTADQSPKWNGDFMRAPALQPGLEPIPGYTLVARLGGGGFGEVWKAESPGGFHVALKFVQIGGRVGETEERSLEIIKDVRHPNLLSVFGTWRIGDLLIIATELADRTLLDRFHEARKEGHGGILKGELLVYLAEAAKGIDFLNDPGKSGRMRIQHRDIKPQNLLISGGSVKVGDFGLARSIQYDVTGHTGSLTFAYAAPECFDGTTSNHSDQYSLAVTYCQLRGGRLPFEGTQVEIMEGHRKKQPDLSMVSAEERPALAKALAKRPKDRWNSCTEFIQAISGSDSQSGAVTDSSLVAIVQRRIAEMPNRLNFGCAAIAAFFLISLSILFFSGDGREGDEQATAGPNGATIIVPSDADAATKPLTLAVIDFDNHSQDPSLDGFRLGFRDMLVTDLSHLSSIKVLERGRLRDLLGEHELAKSPFIDPKSAIRLGKGLSAKHVLTGSYVIAGDDIRVDVRLVSVETGEVNLADSVTGKRSNIFPLQQALSAKVLAGLEIQPTDAEQAALGKPQTNGFDAFRLYSDARVAQLRGEREEAKSRYQEALRIDPDFSLATRELDRLETEALFRLSDTQQQQAKAAGEIGRRLQENWDKHSRIVERDLRDAEYFASIITLAAHAGLYGDFDQERQLLLTYWKQFSESVSPQQSLATAKEIGQYLSTESKFFQENVDSGDYDLPSGNSPETTYLKTELKSQFHWPKWSVIWPFAKRTRGTFGQIEISTRPEQAQYWESQFEAQLPVFPHDYISGVIDFSVALDDRRTNHGRFSETLQICCSVTQYYGQLPNPTQPLASPLKELRNELLFHLEHIDASQADPAVISVAIPALETIVRIETDVQKQVIADKLLVRYIRQTRINEGMPPPPHADPVSFYGQSLKESPIHVIWHVGPDGDSQQEIGEHVRETLGDVLRVFTSTKQFNCLYTGYVDVGAIRVVRPQSV